MPRAKTNSAYKPVNWSRKDSSLLFTDDNIDLNNEILSNSTDHSSSLSSVNRPQSSDTFLVLWLLNYLKKLAIYLRYIE